jgi:hypothetical protein
MVFERSGERQSFDQLGTLSMPNGQAGELQLAGARRYSSGFTSRFLVVAALMSLARSPFRRR